MWLATAPGSGTGVSWADYHPVPRGSTFTYRDEQNRVITEAIGPTTGAASATPVVVRDNVYLGNLLVASISNAMGGPLGWQYYSSDHLGSIRLAMLPGSTNVTHKYWPYGEELPVAPPVDQRITFARMERDTEANHFYDHARTHDFNLGRFLSPDKVGGKVPDPQSWNRYAYAKNNPLKYVDPSGLDAVVVTFPNYQIATPVGRLGGLGHAGIVLIDNRTGATRYYEYGRYDASGKGLVRQRTIPDVVMGKNGLPTDASILSRSNAGNGDYLREFGIGFAGGSAAACQASHQHLFSA